jgi:hypothetical protein
MTIQSMDQLITAFSASQSLRSDWNKNALPTTAQVAGQWYDLGLGTGNPQINAIIGSGTNLAHQGVTETTTTTATTTALNGSIATTVFTDTTHSTGRFTVGMVLTGTGVTAGTTIISLGTGTGANAGGTYNLNISQTVTSQTITGTASPGGIPHGGDVSTNVKQLSSASVFSAAATSAPAVFMLVDVLAVYAVSSITTTGAQSFTGQASWPRYADGKGVRAYLVPSIVMGAGTPTVQLSYTNPASTAGRLTPSAPSLPVINTTSPVGAVPYAGTGVGKVGPFLPLASGDTGILSVQSINFSATMVTGCMNLVICKPLAQIPITTVGVAGERDFLNMLPSWPRIYDGACLSWLMYAGAATPVNSAYYGHLDTVWG